MGVGSAIRISILANSTDAVRGLRETGDAAEKMGGKLSGGIGKMAGLAAGAVGIGTVVSMFSEGASEAQAFQDAANQTAEALKTNAKLAGLSVDQVQKNSAAIESLTGAKIDENAATDAQNKFIRAGITSQAGLQAALKTSADVAMGTGKDLGAVSVSLSKALADPTRAQGVLAKAGVVLSDSQQAAITAMANSGDAAGAQAAILDALEGKYKGASEAAGKGFSADIGRAKDALADAERDIVAKMLPTVSKLATMFAENLPKAIAAATPVVKGIFEVLKNPAFQIFAGTILAVVAGMKIYAAYVAVVSAVTKAWAAIQTVLNVIMALNPVTIIIIAIIALVAIIVLIATKTTWFQTLWKGAMAGISAAVNWIKEAASSVFGWIAQNWPMLLAIVTGPIGLIVLFIVRHWDEIKAATLAVFDAIKSAIGAALDWIVGLVTTVWDGIKAYFTFVFGIYKAIFDAGLGALKSVWSGLTWLYDKAVAVFGVIKDAIAAALGWVRDRIQDTVNRALAIWGGIVALAGKVAEMRDMIIGYLSGLVDRFIQVGQNIMRGLADGISRGIGWVRDKVSGLGSMIPDWLKSVLGIHSPSKVMAGLGKNVVQGLGKGITSQLPALRRTLSGVSSTITGSLSASPSVTVGAATVDGGAAGGSRVYQINVNVPVGGDLAETGRQVVKAVRSYESATGRTVLATA